MMAQPINEYDKINYCEVECKSLRCRSLSTAEHTFFAYFAVEMAIKMLAMGVFGRGSYLSVGWNRFDCFIIVSGLTEYIFSEQDLNISAIRALRILRPLRALTRISSLQLLVSWIFSSLILLGNVMVLCLFIFFVFAVVSVQLWAGLFRQRCFFPKIAINYSQLYDFLPDFYSPPHEHFVCSNTFGYLTCDKVQEFENSLSMCHELLGDDTYKENICNQHVANYTDCRPEGQNPFPAMGFDNFGMASVTLFQVISLQAWTDIMYLVQDAYSFWSWTFFVAIIFLESYFAIRLCLVVVVAQFTVSLEKERLLQKKANRKIEDEFEGGIYEQSVNAIIEHFGSTKTFKEHVTNPRTECIFRGIDSFRSFIRRTLERPTIQIVISLLIVGNAVVMALEHHNQPKIFTDILEATNTAMTIVFVFEFLIRVFALGIADFIRDPFNMMDCLVSVFNLIDVASKNSNLPGISVLRIFRLARLVKLLRFFPNLQTQILLMLQTIANVSIFFLLFGFITFVAALLGMTFFGCKTCKSPPLLALNTESVKKVSITRTQEKHCSLGVYSLEDDKLLNVLINSSDTSKLGSTLCGFLNPSSFPGLGNNNTEQNLCPVERYSELFHSMFTVLQIFTRDNWPAVMRSTISYTSTWSSIYYIFLIFIGDFCIFNILAGILVQGFSLRAEEKLKQQKKLSRPSLEGDVDEDQKNGSNTQNSRLKKAIQYALNGCDNQRSLFIFSRDNSFREWLIETLATQYFDAFTILLTLSSFVIICFEKPSGHIDSEYTTTVDLMNQIVGVFFCIEALAKIIANGFLLGQKTYLKDRWNLIDFLLAVVGVAEIVGHIVFRKNPDHSVVQIFRILHPIRTLRPFRLITRTENLRTVLKSLFLSLKSVGNIVLICCVLFFIFGVLGVQLFKGCMAKCVVPHVDNATELNRLLLGVKNREDCLSSGLVWQKGSNHFDNLEKALVALFMVGMEDSWTELTHQASHCLGPELQPTKEFSISAYLYFVSFIFLVKLFALNLFVGVVVNAYQKVQAKEIGTTNKNKLKKAKTARDNFVDHFSFRRQALCRFVTHKYFEFTAIGIVAFNVILLALEHHQMDPRLKFLLDRMNIFFLALLCIEILLKGLALGPIRYFRNGWNVADVIITIFSLVGVFIEYFSDNFPFPVNSALIRVVRVFRVFRALKLMKNAKSLHQILKTISRAIPQAVGLSGLIGLYFLVYGAIGVQLFGRFRCDATDSCVGLSRNCNFESLGMSLLALFRVFTGDGWNSMLNDILMLSDQDKYCSSAFNVFSCTAIHVVAPWYFISFCIVSQFILLNAVVAILMEQISELSKDQLENLENDISHDAVLLHETPTEKPEGIVKKKRLVVNLEMKEMQ